MKKKELKANESYLADNDVFVIDGSVWEDRPYSRECCFRTPSGGDFSVIVDELTNAAVLEYLQNYDINDAVQMWWDGSGVPFDNIRDLYNDIEEWKNNFTKIAEGMPY